MHTFSKGIQQKCGVFLYILNFSTGYIAIRQVCIGRIIAYQSVLANLTVHVDDMTSSVVHRGFGEQPVSRPERSGHKGEGGLKRDDAIEQNGNPRGSADDNSRTATQSD